MDFQDCQRLCDRIITGISIIRVGDTHYFISDPSPKDRLLANLRYDEVFNDPTNDFPSEKLMEKILANKNIWGPDQQKELEDLQKKKKLLAKAVNDLEFQSRKKSYYVNELNKLSAQIQLLNKQKNTLTSNTREYIATIEKYKYLTYLLTRDCDNQKIWNTWQEFIESDDQFITFLMNSSFLNSDLNEEKIRYLAHNEPWRSIWVASKKSGNLLRSPLAEMSDYQRILVSWSLIYDSVYESPDCPSDEVLNNNDLLDNWLTKQSEKRKKDAKNNGSFTENDKILNSGEICIMVDSEEDAKRVYEMNDVATQQMTKKRQDLIKEKGSIIEGHMPDTKIDLQLRKNRIANAKIRQS